MQYSYGSVQQAKTLLDYRDVAQWRIVWKGFASLFVSKRADSAGNAPSERSWRVDETYSALSSVLLRRIPNVQKQMNPR